MSDAQEWENKLVGKKHVESSAESTNGKTFTSDSLPKPSRVLRSGDMLTMDHAPDRLNVHLDDNNVCTAVTLG